MEENELPVADPVTIDGFEGDVLIGGTRNDLLVGDLGRDRFVFDTTLDAATNVGHIVDFAVGADLIVLDDSAFAGLAQGSLSVDAFALGTAATDADDRIIYDAATGALLFDADGSGAGAAVEFAVLDNLPANLSASNFLLI